MTLMALTMRTRLLALIVATVAGCGAPPQQQEPRAATAEAHPAADMLRGRDLYQTHCIACHTAQVHWRDKSLVHSWEDLRRQVIRFERIAGQEWSEQEIDDVAAYLNRLFYQLPCKMPGCGGPSGEGRDGDTLARAP